MKYKIIVDKQSRTNPSADKREYEIDIEELRVKGDVYDSLVITKDEDYVMRRLELTDFHVLNVLEQPKEEVISDVNIELFEGDNYIYLFDMTGNRFYAEYLIQNDFNDIYATVNEMHSAINENARQIELSVSEKLKGYSNTEETKALIELLSNQINLKLEKKVDGDTITGAYLLLLLNGDTSEAKLNADKIDISGKAVNFKTEINQTFGPFTSADQEKIRQYILGNTSLTDEEFAKYDINGDGRVRTTDYIMVKNAVEQGGGYRTDSGTYELNPYSANKFLSLYNNKTNEFDVIISLMYNFFDNLRVNNLSVVDTLSAENFGAPGFKKSDSGLVLISPSAPNTPTLYAINFSTEFDNEPNIVATAKTSVPGTTVTGVGASITSISGANIYVTRTNTTDTGVYWVAIEP